MNEELRSKALSKMLEEMNEKHTPAIDQIHNWLCDQDDEVLMQNILKDGKTIAGAFEYAKNNARKEAKNGVACIDDATVFGWVKDYFASDVINKPVAVAKEKKDAEPENDTDVDQEDEPEKVKKLSKNEIEEAEKVAKEKAAAASAEAVRKAAPSDARPNS